MCYQSYIYGQNHYDLAPTLWPWPRPGPKGRLPGPWGWRRLADAAQVGLLYRLAEKSGERYEKLARLYAHRFLLHEEYPSWALDLVPMPGRS